MRLFAWLNRPSTKKLCLELITRAEELGAHEDKTLFAQELVENREAGVCFELLITHMNEQHIAIDGEFYELICRLGEQMKIPPKEYVFMKELITKK